MEEPAVEAAGVVPAVGAPSLERAVAADAAASSDEAAAAAAGLLLKVAAAEPL